jgi:RNA polymerase sigma factor (TIGR02999 family)
MAKERNGHTLQATALVHEAYLRLLNKQEVEWSSAGHFFGAAAEAMRRILIERARQRQSQKRGGDCERIELSVDLLPEAQDERLMQLDEALDALRAYDVRKEQVVKLRYFAGLTNPEVAAVLDISTATVERDWLFARAWLKHRIG